MQNIRTVAESQILRRIVRVLRSLESNKDGSSVGHEREVHFITRRINAVQVFEQRSRRRGIWF
jgi:hypothetical protein